MKISKTVNKLYAEGAFVWGDYATDQEKKSGEKVLRLQVGQPDFPPHPILRKAVAEAYLEGKTAYGAPLGLEELREAVAQDVNQYYRRIQMKKENVAITAGGGKAAIGVVFRALLNAGDKVLVPCYNYPGYFGGISDAGGRWVAYRLLPEAGYEIDVVDLEKKIKKSWAKVLVLISPGNPTGGVASAETLEKVAFLAKKHDLVVVTDEIYRGHVFDGKFVSILEFAGMEKRTVVIDGPAKRNCVPGMRIGYIIAPADFIDGPIRRLNNVRFSCPPMAEQIGLAKTINHPQVQQYIKEMVAEFKKRRDFVVNFFQGHKKIFCPKPGGAFYVFLDLQKAKISGESFAKKLLREKNVCVLPGESFGGGMIDPQTKKPYGYYQVRLSIASPMAVIKEALKRINQLYDQSF